MKKLFFSIAATLLFIATSHAGVRSLYVPNYGIESGKEHQEKVLYTESNTIRFLLSSEQVHEEKSLYFTPNITTFLRDAEYFLPYMEGYTASGFLMKPAFSYQHDQTLRATVGVHLTGIAGDHVGIHKVSPIVTLEYAPTKWLKIVGGTLDGNLAHKLYEPMFDFDRYFYKHKEDGLQAFAHTAHWNSEIWCDWEDFITIGADWQEKFTFGWTNEFHIRPFRKKGIEFQLPLHLMMNHRGGQINTLPDTCLETLANLAVGIKYVATTKGMQFIADAPVFGFSNRSDEEHIHTHFKDGWGIYPQFALHNTRQKHHWSATIGFWHADGFISGRGGYLFQSRSYFDPDFERRRRDMMTAKASYCLNSILGIEFQAYYDLDESSTDYSAGIYLKFDKPFKIHTWE